MFDKSIIENDWFMDLSMSSKALYFLLGMEADDEWFVSPRRVMRIYWWEEDDLKVLIIKKFVIQFKSGVVVITNWKENNYLDKNKIKETKYLIEKSMLETNNNKYQLISQSKLKLTESLPSIEESSIEESRIEEKKMPPAGEFEIFWKKFPHARKWKKRDAEVEFKKQNVDEVMQEVKFLNRKIEMWLQDWNFVPACERWIRDFVQTAKSIKEQDLKKIVYAIMDNKEDNRKDQANRFKQDFWEDVVEKYRQQRSKEKNWLTLKFI